MITEVGTEQNTMIIVMMPSELVAMVRASQTRQRGRIVDLVSSACEDTIRVN